jgi:hypothetical protein
MRFHGNYIPLDTGPKPVLERNDVASEIVAKFMSYLSTTPQRQNSGVDLKTRSFLTAVMEKINGNLHAPAVVNMCLRDEID